MILDRNKQVSGNFIGAFRSFTAKQTSLKSFRGSGILIYG